jgi:hypothetical protein
VAETAGAVSTPLLEMDPAVVDQMTDVLLVPLTDAENCCVLPAFNTALSGFTLTLMLDGEGEGDEGGLTATVANAFESGETTLAAVTVTKELVETVGAVSTPLLEIDPAVVDHLTAALLDPLTVAKNCCVAPDATVVLEGDN